MKRTKHRKADGRRSALSASFQVSAFRFPLVLGTYPGLTPAMLEYMVATIRRFAQTAAA